MASLTTNAALSVLIKHPWKVRRLCAITRFCEHLESWIQRLINTKTLSEKLKFKGLEFYEFNCSGLYQEYDRLRAKYKKLYGIEIQLYVHGTDLTQNPFLPWNSRYQRCLFEDVRYVRNFEFLELVVPIVNLMDFPDI